MKKNIGVSIIVPAFNEEDNISLTVKGVIREVSKITDDFEIIIVDDGSSDDTGLTAGKLENNDKKIKLISYKKNRGFAFAIRKGLENAKKEYFVWFPGDNDTSPVSLKNIVKEAGTADLIIAYSQNPGGRSFFRQCLSKAFVIFMNTIFGLDLRYYTGCYLCRTGNLKKIKIISKGFASVAEVKIKMIYDHASYREIPFEHIGRKSGKSKALSINQITDTVHTIFALIRDILFLKKI